VLLFLNVVKGIGVNQIQSFNGLTASSSFPCFSSQNNAGTLPTMLARRTYPSALASSHPRASLVQHHTFIKRGQQVDKGHEKRTPISRKPVTIQHGVLRCHPERSRGIFHGDCVKRCLNYVRSGEYRRQRVSSGGHDTLLRVWM